MSSDNFEIVLEDSGVEPFKIIIDREKLKDIAIRIWSNECGKTKEDKLKNLIHWNEHEDHASIGIMHFTWYKYAVENDQFPLLREYIKNETGKMLPKSLNGLCPWKSRKHFLREVNSKKVQVLKQFLLDTVVLQAKFLILERFKNVLRKMNEMFGSEGQMDLVRQQFFRILGLPDGLFIILDTLNMSGEKGLYNTLKQLTGSSNESALDEFKRARINRFNFLVETNPKLKIFYNGWLNRINCYGETCNS